MRIFALLIYFSLFRNEHCSQGTRVAGPPSDFCNTCGTVRNLSATVENLCADERRLETTVSTPPVHSRSRSPRFKLLHISPPFICLCVFFVFFWGVCLFCFVQSGPKNPVKKQQPLLIKTLSFCGKKLNSNYSSIIRVLGKTGLEGVCVKLPLFT